MIRLNVDEVREKTTMNKHMVQTSTLTPKSTKEVTTMTFI